MRDLLEWVAGETGWAVAYEDDALAASVGGIELTARSGASGRTRPRR